MITSNIKTKTPNIFKCYQNRKDMKKLILDYSQCGLLRPHWFELDPEKTKRLSSVNTKKSNFGYHKSEIVLNTPPIIIFEDYILNGKHRAYIAHTRGASLEVCSINNEHDIIHHTPFICYGETGLEGVLKALTKRELLQKICQNQGIKYIKDFTI